MLKNKNFKKNYMYVNYVLLGLCIYVIFFPFISKLISTISPNIMLCPYLAMTDTPCPLCGGTRYIAGLSQVFQNPSYLLNPFGIIVLFILFQIIFRLIYIFKISKKENIKTFVYTDIAILIIATVSFFLYEILYFIK